MAGQIIRAADHLPAVFAEDPSNLTNLTNTGWAAGDPALSITFTAPTSGRGRIDIAATIDEDTDAGGVRCSVEVREGGPTGAVVFSPSLDNGIRRYWSVAAPENETDSAFVFLSGLNPGGIYWAQFQFQIRTTPTGGLDIDHRVILYQPLT